MTKSSPITEALAKKRSAQAARAFLNRPQAGVQGAPQNRAERRAAARNAGRKPATATVNTTASVRAQENAQALTGRQVLAQAPAELARDVKETAASVRQSMAGTPLFPWRDMKISLPLFVLFAVLLVAWWNIVGSHPAWLASVKPHLSTITAVLTGGAFLSLIGISARTFLPAVGCLVLALGSATFGDKAGFFGPGVIMSGVLGLSWVVGPIPGLGGKLFRRKST